MLVRMYEMHFKLRIANFKFQGDRHRAVPLES